MAVLKMALVVVLALGTKKFAIWITISALLLMFLEFVSKKVHKLLKHSLDTQKSLNSLVQRVLGFLRINHDKVEHTEEVIRVLKLPIEQEKESGVSADYSALSGEEIQIVPSSSELEMNECDNNWVCGKQGGDHTSEVVGLKKRHSSKIKSKIRRLVKKQLCSSYKKKRKDLKSEEQEKKFDGDGSLSFSSSGEIGCSEVEEIAIKEEVKRETERFSECLILVLIVLVGLLGGRGSALVITFSWCLTLKLAGKLRRLKLGDHDQLSCQI